MDLSVLVYLTSGLFLGWSLGANDAANVFGMAVATRMVQFKTAAVICSVFVILGAVISGSGGASTLSRLGHVNTISGAFMVALAAAITVYNMVKLRLPSSTTQAIIGGIVGWNLYAGKPTDMEILLKIIMTWVLCPLLAAAIAILLYKLVTFILNCTRIHILRMDMYTRFGLIFAGAFGAYSLGANNIANVMGVFVEVSPFTNISIGQFTFTSLQQLFLLGAIAIAVGVFTYSYKMMLTVGSELSVLSPIAAWVVVIAHSFVLFMFASQSIKTFLESNNFPSLLLVPVSSTQAVVGAIVGIGLITNRQSIRWGKISQIFVSWVVTPITAALICFVSLFFLQNVFNQSVYQ